MREDKNTQDYAIGHPAALWSNLDVMNLLVDSKTN